MLNKRYSVDDPRVQDVHLAALVDELGRIVQLGYGSKAVSPESSPVLVAAARQVADVEPQEAAEQVRQVQRTLEQAFAVMRDKSRARAARLLLGIDSEAVSQSLGERQANVAEMLEVDDLDSRRAAFKSLLTEVAIAVGESASRRQVMHRPRFRQLLGSQSHGREPLLSNIPLTDLQTAQDAVDPAKFPEEYTELLLGIAGSVDPFNLQRATIFDLAPLESVDDEKLMARESDGEWSVLEVIGHMVDSELNAAIRYRIILCEQEPFLTSYSQDDWVRRLAHNHSNVHALLDQFEILRSANLDLWQSTSAEERAKVGVHAERGPQSLETLFRMQAGHDVMHLSQIYRTLAGRAA